MVLSDSKNKGKLGLKVGAKCVGEAEGIKQGPKQCEGLQGRVGRGRSLVRVSGHGAVVC